MKEIKGEVKKSQMEGNRRLGHIEVKVLCMYLHQSQQHSEHDLQTSKGAC